MTPHRLTAERLLIAWEDGIDASPPAQALAILASVGCDIAAPLPVGARDALLLDLRADSFGQALSVRTECPACACLADAAVDVADVAASGGDADGSHRRELTVNDWTIVYRLPTAQDLLAASHATDVGAARNVLLRACVSSATREGVAADDVAMLDDDVVAQLAEAIEQWDPLVETALAMTCARCGHEWHAVLEIGSYLHTEIADAATRIAREVDELARRYGWRERDILAMSAARRAIYLDQTAEIA